MNALPSQTAADIAAIARIGVVPTLLRLLSEHSGMGFVTVARVTDDTWTACAVRDDIGFGVPTGGQLNIDTTLCKEARATRRPVVISHASTDAHYRAHITPQTYGIESGISVPIILGNGDYFGNLCALDRQPTGPETTSTVALFSSYAALIASQLDADAERRAVDAQLLDARAAAELREQFVAVLGHDLRSPLSAVLLLGQTLARHGDAVDAAAYGERIVASARRMGRLVDDVLDLTRVRLGSGLNLTFETVDDLVPALRAVVQELRDANPRCTITESMAVEGPVFGHRGRLQQLLSNLLSNAVRHGDPSLPIGVTVAVDGADIVLAVRNGGSAIAPDVQRRIFEPYWRAAESGAAEGLGLGLHICTQIVRAHGGTITLDSTPQATVFAARWPRDGGRTTAS